MAELVKILNIEKYKGNTYCVEIEGEDNIYLHSSIISEFHLKSEMIIPQSALEEIIFQNDFRKAKERALYLLDYRDHSYKELYDKLRRNYSPEICNAVMEKMIEIGVIDDRKYAERYARYLFEVKRAGKYKARAEMLKKGIDKEIVDEFLEEYEEDTQERLKELVEKKYARYLTDEKGVQKVFNALVRYGYNYSDVREVIKEFMDEVEFNGD
jgi:regulatory protein